MKTQSVVGFQKATRLSSELNNQIKTTNKELSGMKGTLTNVSNSLVPVNRSRIEHQKTVKEHEHRQKVIATLRSQLTGISSDKPLRMKNYVDQTFKLKPAAYFGFNPFKLLGYGSGRYQDEVQNLKRALGDVTDNTLTRRTINAAMKRADDSSRSTILTERQEIRKLDVQWKNGAREIDSLEEKKMELEEKREKLSVELKTVSRDATPVIDLAHFFNIYSTNGGCKAINASLRGETDIPLSGGDVVREIERRHGDDQFTRGGKQVKGEIKAAAHMMSFENICSVDNYLYAKGLDHPKPGEFYRGVTLSNQGLSQLMACHKSGKFVRPDGLFSCSSRKDAAAAFTTRGRGGETPTIIKIHGQTQHRMTSGLTAKGEAESIFSTNAVFSIKDISERKVDGESYMWIELVEEVGRNQKMAVEKFPY